MLFNNSLFKTYHIISYQNLFYLLSIFTIQHIAVFSTSSQIKTDALKEGVKVLMLPGSWPEKKLGIVG